MLRVTQQTSAEGAKKYYSTADYLCEGQEIVGQWGGIGAKMLGLEGTVDKYAFEMLCDNLDPRTSKSLTVRNRSDRTVGYDLTFSVPKSVSLLYALSGDKEILEAFRSAVEDTMREDIEPEMKTRVRTKGRDENRLTGNLISAEFIHTTSRPVEGIPDPQLHAHCFVLNATWDHEESRFKAGQFRDIKGSAPMYQSMFRVRLANKLQDLGFGITRKRDDFEIAGISDAILKRFSRRTEQIEKVADEKGITNPKLKDELGAKTREAKNHALSWNQLRREWDGRLSDQERQQLAAVHRREQRPARPVKGEKAAVDHALEHCMETEAVVSERKLLTEALKKGIGSVTIGDVKREISRRPLVRAELNGAIMVSTPEMKRAEARLLRIGRDSRGRYRPMGDPNRPCKRQWLNAGQRAAVAHVLGSRDGIALIRGPAGTGKTTLEEELGEALREKGIPVVALAQSTSAVDVLREEAHFGNAETVARFLKDKKLQQSAKGGLVLVDEASLLGTHDMLALFDLGHELGARFCLVGDTKQNRAVSAGEPLRLLETRSGLPTAQVTEIVRQSGDYAKAAKALSDGRTAEGLAELNRLGWIKEIPDGERYQAMADAYLATIREKKRNGEFKTALSVSPTWAEAGKIAEAVRSALKSQGKLDEERTVDVWIPAHLSVPQKADDAGWIGPGDLMTFHQNVPGYKNGSRVVVQEGMKLPLESAKHFQVYRPARLDVAIGDRIRFTAKGKSKDGKHALRNGTLTTLRGFTPGGDLIVENGWVIAKEWGHIAQGYAVSSENSEGRTVDKNFVGIASQSFGAANERRSYVAHTRAREQVICFTDDREGLMKAVQRLDRPLSATELDEARRRHRVPLRQRLKEHFARARRVANFRTMHESRPQPARTQEPIQQERSYGR